MLKTGLKRLTVLVFLVSLVIGVVCGSGCVPIQVIEDISAQEAFDLIQENKNNPDFVILDVRTLTEFADGYIEGAINLDYRHEFFSDILNLIDKDKTYLVYCHSGGRSRSALDIMEELNFREAYNVLGGIVNWKAEGLPTTK
ncbi:rhodanese-like domain-containing protein [Chloroflexota bacterium]